VINRLVIVGATGDLNARYLLPALTALRAAGHLDDRFVLTCADRQDWTGEHFRSWAAAQLDRNGVASHAEARAAITDSAHHRRIDATDAADVAWS
jgi:glucose-6-phosphate 1-dehydrogenase